MTNDTKELRSMVIGAHFEGFANSVIHSLLDRLEAAEKERDDVAQQLVQSEIGKRKISEERDAAELMSLALRVKMEAMERQKPVAWLHESRRDSDVVTDAVKHVWGKVAVGSMAAYSIPLYALPGAKGE